MALFDENKNILIRSRNKDFMFKLRKSINDNFNKIWMFLYNDSDKEYAIEVCDERGFILENSIKQDIANHIKKITKDNKNGR